MKLGLGNSLGMSGHCSGPMGVPIPAAHAQVLYHWNTGFADSSDNNRNATLNSPVPTIVTSQSVFGGASALVQDRGSIEMPGGSHFHFSDGTPFQLRWRMRPTKLTSSEVWFLSSAVGTGGVGFAIRFRFNYTLMQLLFSGSDPTWNIPALSYNTWYAMLLNHDGAGNYRFYINGTRIGTTSSGSGNNSNNLVRLGEPFDQGNGPFHGYVDEFLLEKHADLQIITASTYEVEELPFVLV